MKMEKLSSMNLSFIKLHYANQNIFKRQFRISDPCPSHGLSNIQNHKNVKNSIWKGRKRDPQYTLKLKKFGLFSKSIQSSPTLNQKSKEKDFSNKIQINSKKQVNQKFSANIYFSTKNQKDFIEITQKHIDQTKKREKTSNFLLIRKMKKHVSDLDETIKSQKLYSLLKPMNQKIFIERYKFSLDKQRKKKIYSPHWESNLLNTEKILKITPI